MPAGVPPPKPTGIDRCVALRAEFRALQGHVAINLRRVLRHNAQAMALSAASVRIAAADPAVDRAAVSALPAFDGRPSELLAALLTPGHLLRRFVDPAGLRSISSQFETLKYRERLELLDRPRKHFVDYDDQVAAELREAVRDAARRAAAWQRGGQLGLDVLPREVRVFLRWIGSELDRGSPSTARHLQKLTDRLLSEGRAPDVNLFERVRAACADPESPMFVGRASERTRHPFPPAVFEQFSAHIRRHSAAERFLIDPPDSPEQFALAALDGAARIIDGECTCRVSVKRRRAATAAASASLNYSAALRDLAATDEFETVASKRLFAELRGAMSAGAVSGPDGRIILKELTAVRDKFESRVLATDAREGRDALLDALRLIGDLGAAFPTLAAETAADLRRYVPAPGRISLALAAAERLVKLADSESLALLCARIPSREGSQVKHAERVQLARYAIELAGTSIESRAVVRRALQEYSGVIVEICGYEKVRMSDQCCDVLKLRMRLALGRGYTDEVERTVTKISNSALRNRVQLPVMEVVAEMIEKSAPDIDLQMLETAARARAQSEIGEQAPLRW